jgi:hypothetical protein
VNPLNNAMKSLDLYKENDNIVIFQDMSTLNCEEQSTYFVWKTQKCFFHNCLLIHLCVMQSLN